MVDTNPLRYICAYSKRQYGRNPDTSGGFLRESHLRIGVQQHNAMVR